MQVEVVEVGHRPLLFTKARQYAPAGARVMGEMLSELSFADIGLIVVDWDNTLGLLPADAVKPIMHIRVMKRLPQYSRGNLLTVDDRIDIDDVFGGDAMTAELIADVVHELNLKVDQEIDRRRTM